MADAPVRKKKKRPVASTPVEVRDAALELELPVFAKEFPADRDLGRVVIAFEAGDYARVREEARAIAADAKKPEAVRRAARAMLERLEPPRLAVALVALAFVLLGSLTGYHLSHNDELAAQAREAAAKAGRPWSSARPNASGAPRTQATSNNATP